MLNQTNRFVANLTKPHGLFLVGWLFGLLLPTYTLAQPTPMPCQSVLAKNHQLVDKGMLLCFCDDWIANTEETYTVPFAVEELEELTLTRHFKIDRLDTLKSLADSVYFYFGGIAPGGAIYLNDKLLRVIDATYSQHLVAVPNRLLQPDWNTLRVELSVSAHDAGKWRPEQSALGLYGPVYLLTNQEALLARADSIFLSARSTAACVPTPPDSGQPYIDSLRVPLPERLGTPPANTLVYTSVDPITGMPKTPAAIRQDIVQIKQTPTQALYCPQPLPATVLPDIAASGLALAPAPGPSPALYTVAGSRHYPDAPVWQTENGRPSDAFGRFDPIPTSSSTTSRSFYIVIVLLMLALFTTWRVVDARSLRSYLLLPANVLEKLQKIQQGRLNPPNFIFFLNILRWLLLSALLTMVSQSITRYGGLVKLGFEDIQLFQWLGTSEQQSVWAQFSISIVIVASLLVYQIFLQLLIAGIYQLNRFSFRLQELSALGDLVLYLISLVVFLLLSLQPGTPPTAFLWVGLACLFLGLLLSIILQFLALGRIWKIPAMGKLLYVLGVNLLPLYIMLA